MAGSTEEADKRVKFCLRHHQHIWLCRKSPCSVWVGAWLFELSEQQAVRDCFTLHGVCIKGRLGASLSDSLHVCVKKRIHLKIHLKQNSLNSVSFPVMLSDFLNLHLEESCNPRVPGEGRQQEQKAQVHSCVHRAGLCVVRTARCPAETGLRNWRTVQALAVQPTPAPE